jgi:hypothetical protein
MQVQFIAILSGELFQRRAGSFTTTVIDNNDFLNILQQRTYCICYNSMVVVTGNNCAKS